MGEGKTTLESVLYLLQITRDILLKLWKSRVRFSVFAIPVLNQIVRPFTSKWHRERSSGAFEDENEYKGLRDELWILQEELRNYKTMLAKIAEVEYHADSV